ncbi:MAG: type IV secretory system conjugative DNA transfer family protein [Lachnospiraceae bacterium]|nr:type IV secretory system conjugative DNA transfer family protein [Lachnospiraceae bacterium]
MTDNKKDLNMKDIMILGKDKYYSLDCYDTKVNNNVLVVGTAGSGKTRSIVTPNLLLATGSYIVSDPKGNLYTKYGKYLKAKGYKVRKLDFTDPVHSAHYNPFMYIRSCQDIVKVAHVLATHKEGTRTLDPFWDEAAQLLIQSLIAYLRETCPTNMRNLHSMFKLLELIRIDENNSTAANKMDVLIDQLRESKPDSYAVATYEKFRVAAGKTLKSILITINSRLGLYETPEIAGMTSKDDVDITGVGREKTALFVVVSDTDRSMDMLANIFFTQAMNELCGYADKKCADNRLPVPVRFILDDFATNCKIDDFPRMIASIRSRGISTMLMIQAESQLESAYGDDGRTIIGNCDTYVYLGGNDVGTAKSVAERCDIPAKKVLNMPVGMNWIFRRGQAPVYGENFDLDAMLARMEPEL